MSRVTREHRRHLVDEAANRIRGRVQQRRDFRIYEPTIEALTPEAYWLELYFDRTNGWYVGNDWLRGWHR